MKKQYIIAALVLSGVVYGQVGVNTETPKTTMDISVKRDSGGSIIDNTQSYGLQAPRLTRAELTANTATYGTDQKGALIYITDTSGGNNSGQRTNVTTVGYYYFDGSFWQTFASGGTAEVDGVIGNEVLDATTNGGLTRAGTGTAASPYTLGLTSGTTTGQVMTWNGTAWIPTASANIYNADGSLTSYRTLTLNNNRLQFFGSQQQTSWEPNGGMNIQNLQSGTGTASLSFHGGNDSNLYIQQYNNNIAQILISGNTPQLILGSSATNNPSGISFITTPASNSAGISRMHINPNGKVKIGDLQTATEKLDVDGLLRVRNLPLNGATNAHSTISGDSSSTTPTQTFTATKTLVADANGILGYVAGLPSSDINIYKDNGSLTNLRTVTLAGNNLRFMGQSQRTEISSAGDLSVIGLPGAVGAAFSVDAPDNDNNGSFASLQTQVFAEAEARIHAVNDTKSLTLGTSGNLTAAPIIFNTAPGGSVSGSERMRITGTGNVGVSTNSPTEKLDNSGITRLRSLPLNGATNAINTNSSGNASASQDQTFTATRTLVADANGVLGYVSGLPSTAPSSDGGTIAVGEKIRWQGDVSGEIGLTGGGNTTSSNDPTFYTSYYHNNLPVIEGIRIDPYFIHRASASTTNPNTLYRIVNASTNNIKVSYHSINIESSLQWGDTNVIIAPNQFINASPTGAGNSGENMTTSSTPTNYQSNDSYAIRSVITDIWVNSRWYRVNYFIVVDNNNTTATGDDIRKVNIVVERML